MGKILCQHDSLVEKVPTLLENLVYFLLWEKKLHGCRVYQEAPKLIT